MPLGNLEAHTPRGPNGPDLVGPLRDPILGPNTPVCPHGPALVGPMQSPILAPHTCRGPHGPGLTRARRALSSGPTPRGDLMGQGVWGPDLGNDACMHNNPDDTHWVR